MNQYMVFYVSGYGTSVIHGNFGSFAKKLNKVVIERMREEASQQAGHPAILTNIIKLDK